MAADATLWHTVARWENRLLPMAQFAPAATPPAHVWQAIERRVAPAAAPARRGLFDSLPFWRGLGVVSSALAAVLLVTVLVRQPEVAAPPAGYVALLADESDRPAFVVTGDARAQTLTVRMVARRPLRPDQSFELWAVPKQGAPRSLGLVAADGAVSLRLPADVTPASAPLLAVSLEPKGGSPDPKGPSGPILFKGAWVRVQT